jgi:hypothetical protein
LLFAATTAFNLPSPASRSFPIAHELRMIAYERVRTMCDLAKPNVSSQVRKICSCCGLNGIVF